ncbi:hypothetical protein [Methanothermococcus okinawensis]|uniref:Uncharacterized protein n=1 Tax=Methanothermococcus okinawensis (strain DSM 14208 / JCM 11175 / IH1) TaxID=647113 RepID=F8AKB2_METOI|nr:hypothetical protein [Methanothermococcus okinawensis]AEH06312.1 hypothetical protein Metok_0322 [Methanothermococcus okinawensis IH1]
MGNTPLTYDEIIAKVKRTWTVKFWFDVVAYGSEHYSTSIMNDSTYKIFRYNLITNHYDGEMGWGVIAHQTVEYDDVVEWKNDTTVVQLQYHNSDSYMAEIVIDLCYEIKSNDGKYTKSGRVRWYDYYNGTHLNYYNITSDGASPNENLPEFSINKNVNLNSFSENDNGTATITNNSDGTYYVNGLIMTDVFKKVSIENKEENVSKSFSFTIEKDGKNIKSYNQNGNITDIINKDIGDGWWISSDSTAEITEDNDTQCDIVSSSFIGYSVQPGDYKITFTNKIGVGTIIQTFTFTIKEGMKENINIKISGDLAIKPVCKCYLNSVDSKKITYNYSVSNVKFNAFPNDSNTQLTNIFYENLRDNTKWYLRLFDKDDNKLTEKDITKQNVGTIDYTFNLSKNTVFDGKWELIAKYNKKEYKLDEQQIKVIRQKYCNTIKIDIKMYDEAGTEIDKIPQPTSAGYNKNLHSNINIKINITDEQGKYIDIPDGKIKTNWQQTLTKDDIGKYSFIIPNTDDNALGLGSYGITVYVDRDWCETNGYYNSHNIEANNVMINSNKIEKIMFVGAQVVNYENGITNLDKEYDKISGIFINPQLEFDVVQSTQTNNPLNQYTFCYTPFIASQTLNLPTYTDEEKKELIKAIMRDLGNVRKIETFQIMTKPDKLPKINQNITLDTCIDNQLRTIPIYSINISISNRKLSVKISNEEKKLMKDYLSMLK